MTETNKPVTRRTRSSYRFGGFVNKVVVTIGEGDVLHLRESGRRTSFTLPIDAVYRIAVKRHTDANRPKRRRTKTARRSKLF